MTDDLCLRITTPSAVIQLVSGDWIARRLGIAGTGPTPEHAVADMVTKELLHNGIRVRISLGKMPNFASHDDENACE